MAEEPDEDADDEQDSGPVVELGEAGSVEGAPLGRVTSRLTWPQEKSEIDRKEGDTTIRTPNGPAQLTDVLADVETTYFATRQEFTSAVKEVIGTGPVPTE